MLVRKSGSKIWRARYTLKGSTKENTYTIGAYPLIGLNEARKLKDEVKKQLLNGIDPNKKKEADRKQEAIDNNTFECIARDWLVNYVPWLPMVLPLFVCCIVTTEKFGDLVDFDVLILLTA